MFPPIANKENSFGPSGVVSYINVMAIKTPITAIARNKSLRAAVKPRRAAQKSWTRRLVKPILIGPESIKIENITKIKKASDSISYSFTIEYNTISI